MINSNNRKPNMNPNATITNLIGKIKLQYPEFVDKSGLGYCANASMVLQAELKKINIEGKLLYGKYLKDNKEGNTAKAHFSNLIKHFPVENAFHGRVKSHFVKNGNKISDKGGHVALLVGDVLYDVTSAQFGLPISYSLDRFLEMWADVHVVDITMKPERTAWNQKVLYTYQTKEKDTVAMEGLIDITGNVDEQDRIDFNKWFSIQSKQVQANCKIVSSDELGQDYMLHIDKNTPVRFIGAMPRSAAPSENNTTARITVAPTLLGCLFGYARYEYDFRYGLPTVSKEKDKYRGGYEICELPFKHCLQPNSKLVYDSEYTGEHWLVTYNKPTLHYVPVKIGKAFIYKMDYKSTGKTEPIITYEMYVEVHKEDGIKLTPTTHINKGFHKVVFTIVEDSVNVNKVDKENDLVVTEISSGEYNKIKQLSAAMLSMESNSIPKYLKW